MKTFPPSPLLLALTGLAARSAAACSISKPRAATTGATACPGQSVAAKGIFAPFAPRPATPAPALAFAAVPR